MTPPSQFLYSMVEIQPYRRKFANSKKEPLFCYTLQWKQIAGA